MPTIAGGVVRPHPLKAPGSDLFYGREYLGNSENFQVCASCNKCLRFVDKHAEYFFTKEQEGQAGDQGDPPGEFQRVMVSQAYAAQVAGPEVLSREGC